MTVCRSWLFWQNLSEERPLIELDEECERARLYQSFFWAYLTCLEPCLANEPPSLGSKPRFPSQMPLLPNEKVWMILIETEFSERKKIRLEAINGLVAFYKEMNPNYYNRIPFSGRGKGERCRPTRIKIEDLSNPSDLPEGSESSGPPKKRMCVMA